MSTLFSNKTFDSVRSWISIVLIGVKIFQILKVKLLIKVIISKERRALQFQLGLVHTISILGAFSHNGGRTEYVFCKCLTSIIDYPIIMNGTLFQCNLGHVWYSDQFNFAISKVTWSYFLDTDPYCYVCRLVWIYRIIQRNKSSWL